MIAPDPIGWFNTGLPLTVLAALALALPYLVVPRETRSQARLAVGIGLTAGLVAATGAGVFAALYGAQGHAVGTAFSADPLGVAWFFAARSAMAGLLWGPVLALVWLGRAQAIEARKGRDIARCGPATDEVTG